MKQLQDNTNKTIFESLEELRKRIISNSTDAGQKASGNTEKSLHVEIESNHGALLGRKYFGTLEDGRNKGKVPIRFNDIIAKWIIDKGISIVPIPYKRKESDKWHPKYTPEQRGLMSFSGAIANKIREEGTQLYRKGGRKDIYTPEIKKTKAEIKKKLAGIYKTEFQTINKEK